MQFKYSVLLYLKWLSLNIDSIWMWDSGPSSEIQVLALILLSRLLSVALIDKVANIII
jgi:hypothetical protein